ncbi:NUDIX hydrolase [Streptomyces sp. NPDC052051]|uniref:NUDIX hydrolase n=1 Tax=Streptomyces sp. NPDC052051 TaxID=3154649 RepID=UPI003433B5C7
MSGTSGAGRHTEPLDVHLLLRRETGHGPEILLSRRAGAVYAAGLWHLPSGHLDGPHEDVVTAVVREAREETGVVIEPADVRAAVTVHHRSPAGSARTGVFFEVRRWTGVPRIVEPDVCDAMEWVRLDALPAPMVAYCRAGLDAYAAGARLAIHFQLPGDTIAHDPGADRLRLVPPVDATDPDPTACPVPRTQLAVRRRLMNRDMAPADALAPADSSTAADALAMAGRPVVHAAASADAEGVARLRSTDEPAVPSERDHEHVWMPPEQYAETVLKATAFACFYFTDEDDRPLQLHSVYSPVHPWQLVGGTMDPGERPWQTAVRECQEETGFTPSGPPQLLAMVYSLPGTEWPYSTMGLIFDGGRLTTAQIRAIVVNPQEHDEVRVLPLPDWEALMPPRDFARLSAVAEARRTGVAAYFDTWDW